MVSVHAIYDPLNASRACLFSLFLSRRFQVKKSHELAVQLSVLEQEQELRGEEEGGVDLRCARSICGGIQQQALLEVTHTHTV